jgi:hypothetical protein
MIRRRRGHLITVALMASMAFAVSGCIEYTIETRLNADGSGHRSVRVEGTDAHRLDESRVTYDEFTEFMSLSEDEGWTHSIEIQSDGDTTYVFAKEESLSDLSSWSSLTDEIHVTGARESTAGDQIGYVTLGDVRFRNSVRVRSGGNEDGAATYFYEETFRWRNAVDVIFESIVRTTDRSIKRAYPLLTDRERGEIVGAARAYLWAAAEEGLLDSIGEDDDVLWDRVLDQTSTRGIKVVQTRYAEATRESLRAQLDLLSEELSEDAWDELNYLVPGLSAATNSNFKFYLTMPGQVTTTNAHSRDGDLLIWEFNPTDALTAPIVLVAESVVGG